MSSARTVHSDAKGLFTFTFVPPGQWSISASADRAGVIWRGRASVIMPGRDLDHVEVHIDPPFTYEARLQGVPADQSASPMIELRPSSGGSTPASRAKSGTAHLERVYPANYRVGVHGAVRGYYVKSILLDTVDVSGRPVDIGPSSPPLKIVYATNGGRVSGEVEDGAGARVVLIWADRDNYTPGADIVTTACNDNGRFTISDLRPGSWYALALPPSPGFFETGPLRDRVFAQGLWRQLAAVRTAEGETVTLKLKVLP